MTEPQKALIKQTIKRLEAKTDFRSSNDNRIKEGIAKVLRKLPAGYSEMPAKQMLSILQRFGSLAINMTHLKAAKSMKFYSERKRVAKETEKFRNSHLSIFQEDNKSVCLVCDLDMTHSFNHCLLDCAHLYCPVCLKTWLSSKNSCPHCNKSITFDERKRLAKYLR